MSSGSTTFLTFEEHFFQYFLNHPLFKNMYLISSLSCVSSVVKPGLSVPACFTSLHDFVQSICIETLNVPSPLERWRQVKGGVCL